MQKIVDAEPNRPEDCNLAQSLFFCPAGYFTPAPTSERG